MAETPLDAATQGSAAGLVVVLDYAKSSSMRRTAKKVMAGMKRPSIAITIVPGLLIVVASLIGLIFYATQPSAPAAPLTVGILVLSFVAAVLFVYLIARTIQWARDKKGARFLAMIKEDQGDGWISSAGYLWNPTYRDYVREFHDYYESHSPILASQFPVYVFANPAGIGITSTSSHRFDPTLVTYASIATLQISRFPHHPEMANIIFKLANGQGAMVRQVRYRGLPEYLERIGATVKQASTV